MAANMTPRYIFLPTGTLSLTVAKAAATRLCRRATLDELLSLLDHGWIGKDALPEASGGTREQLAAHADTLRRAAERELHRLLDCSALSLTRRDVDNSGSDPGAVKLAADPNTGLRLPGPCLDEFEDGRRYRESVYRDPVRPDRRRQRAAAPRRRPRRGHVDAPRRGPARRYRHSDGHEMVVRAVERGTRTVDGAQVCVTELVWSDAGRSFQVRRADTAAHIGGSFDSWPSDAQIARALHDTAQRWSCLGCRATVEASQPDLIDDHLIDCIGVEFPGLAG